MDERREEEDVEGGKGENGKKVKLDKEVKRIEGVKTDSWMAGTVALLRVG